MAKSDKLSPNSPAWHACQARWRHNSFLGHCAMMKANCNAIQSASTTTHDAKVLAAEIWTLAERLRQALKQRKDK